MSNNPISTKPYVPLSLTGVFGSEYLKGSLQAGSMDLTARKNGEAERDKRFFEQVWQAIVKVLDLTNRTAAEIATQGMAEAPTDKEKLAHYRALMRVTAEKDHGRFTYEVQGVDVVLRVTDTPLELRLGVERLGDEMSQVTGLAQYSAVEAGDINASVPMHCSDEIPRESLPSSGEGCGESADNAPPEVVGRESPERVLSSGSSVPEKGVEASSPIDVKVESLGASDSHQLPNIASGGGQTAATQAHAPSFAELCERAPRLFARPGFEARWMEVKKLIDEPRDAEKMHTAKVLVALLTTSKFGPASQLESFERLRAMAVKSSHKFQVIEGPKGEGTYLLLGLLRVPLTRNDAQRTKTDGRDHAGVADPRTHSARTKPLTQRNEPPTTSRTLIPVGNKHELRARPSHNTAPSGVQRPTTQATAPTWADIERFFDPDQRNLAKAHLSAILNPHLGHTSKVASFKVLKELARREARDAFSVNVEGEGTALKIGEHVVTVERDGFVANPKAQGLKS